MQVFCVVQSIFDVFVLDATEVTTSVPKGLGSQGSMHSFETRARGGLWRIWVPRMVPSSPELEWSELYYLLEQSFDLAVL